MARFKKACDVKVGVIGYGGIFNMGQIHLNEMKKAGMTPVAVCDKDTKRLKVAETDFPGIETYTSITTMLKKSDVNLIVLITPHNMHAKQAAQCLNAGKHVICEKPLAITTEECDKMIATAKAKKLVLSTYHNRHWDGCILETMKHMKKGVIGDVVRIQAFTGCYEKPGDWWRSSKSISGGVMYDWGVHILEYALQVLELDNAKITEVAGFAKNGFWADKTAWKKDTNEDESFSVIRFNTGQWLTLTATQLDMNPQQSILEITGTKGTFLMNGGDYKIIKRRGKEEVVTTGSNCKDDWPQFYQNVADHMVKGDKLIISPEWSRRPIHILDLTCKSYKSGKTLAAKYG
jgi:scyllo-inositol 2-dehydrogenase (NADP+)